MTDMLVRLYDLPPLQPEIDAQVAVGITIRRVIGPRKTVLQSGCVSTSAIIGSARLMLPSVIRRQAASSPSRTNP